MKNDLYHNRKLRFILALLASLYMLFHGRPLDIYQVIISPIFYIALIVSLGIGLLLVYYIHRITIWLDGRCGWRTMPIERALLQLLLGVIVPAVIDVTLISIYFQAIGQDVLENGFLLIDFPVIICLITFFNLYYLIHYLIVSEKVSNTSNRINYSDSSETMENLSENGSDSDVDDDIKNWSHLIPEILFQFPFNDILCFYRLGKKIKVLTVDKKEFLVVTTIAKLSEYYTELGFSQINRGMIVNHLVIENYVNGSRRNTLQLVLGQEYGWAIKIVGADQFQVTKDYIDSFITDLKRFNDVL